MLTPKIFFFFFPDLHAYIYNDNMTTPAQRAQIVTAAEAVEIINMCLFGKSNIPSQPRAPTHRRARRRGNTFTPDQISNADILDGVVLEGLPGAVPPAMPSRPDQSARFWRPIEHPGFLPGLCYLAAVRECNVHKAVESLGYYPTVFTLRNSPLIEQRYAFVLQQRPGLFHMVTTQSPYAAQLLDVPGHWLVGAQLPRAGPSMPRAGPSNVNASWGRPMSPEPPRLRPAFRGPQAIPAGGSQGPQSVRAPLPPQEFLARNAARVDAGPPGPQHRKYKGKGKGKQKYVPFAPYSTDPQARRPSSPVAKWRAAISDPLDDAMNGFRAMLDEFPAALTKPAWSDLVSFMNKAKKQSDFDRKGFVPRLKEEFDSLLEKVQAAASAQQEEEQKHEEALTAASNELTNMVARLRDLDQNIADPLPGADVPALEAERRLLSARISEQEKLVDMMDGAEEPAETEQLDAPSVAAPDVPPLQNAPRPSYKDLWPETNYQDHAARTAPLFPTVTGKVPIADLKPVMRDQVDSKLYLPRSLELYSCDELAKLAPRGGARWNNRYEDPLEPVKSWSWSEFENVYNKPGYHFMFARVAQLGPMFKDPKLSLLRSKLAQRWQCEVHFERMSPRQDWMLCTVPSGSKGETEAQSFDLIRLAETNAVYVICRFAPLSRARDLEWVVKGSVADETSIFLQMRKRLLEFETDEVRLGWRVLGVRRGGATSKFRGTFTLESEDVYWPWSMEFGHKHGSVPDASPLLNFEPTWSAKRPYACQGCYSSDHFTAECPLPFMKLGGLSVISAAARSLVLKKKAGERVIDLEKATWQLPIRVPPSPSVKSAPAPQHAPLPKQAAVPPALSVVEEENPDGDVDMEESDDESILERLEPTRITSLSEFLCGRLLGNSNPVVGLTRSLIFSVCKFFGGSIHPVLFSLRRDGHLPSDVSNETLVDEYARPPSEFSPSPPGSKLLPHDCHTTLTRVGLVPINSGPPQGPSGTSGVLPPILSAAHSGEHAVDQSADCERRRP